MKKIALALILCGVAASLTACGGNYRRMQSIEEQNAPYTCAGLHMKNAQWHFVDDFGQRVDVIGQCNRGLKHGTFEFYVERQMIAKTKYVRDNEAKTTCLVQGKSKIDLNTCMKYNAELRLKEAAASQNAIPNVTESADNTAAQENIEQEIQ